MARARGPRRTRRGRVACRGISAVRSLRSVPSWGSLPADILGSWWCVWVIVAALLGRLLRPVNRAKVRGRWMLAGSLLWAGRTTKVAPPPGVCATPTRPWWAVDDRGDDGQAEAAAAARAAARARGRRGRTARTPCGPPAGRRPGRGRAPRRRRSRRRGGSRRRSRPGCPGGVWLRALATRLVSTWRSRASSPGTTVGRQLAVEPDHGDASRPGSRARASWAASAGEHGEVDGRRAASAAGRRAGPGASRSSTSPPIRRGLALDAAPSRWRRPPARARRPGGRARRSRARWPAGCAARGRRRRRTGACAPRRPRARRRTARSGRASTLSERDREVTSSLAARVGDAPGEVAGGDGGGGVLDLAAGAGRRGARHTSRSRRRRGTARPMRSSTRISRVTVCSTERSGTATTKVAVPSSRLPATARQRTSPFVDPTVKGVPWRTRGSFERQRRDRGLQVLAGGWDPAGLGAVRGQQREAVAARKAGACCSV